MQTSRKVIVEMPRVELERSNYVPGLEGVESLSIVQLLRYDPHEFAGVVRVKLRPPLKDTKGLVGIAGKRKVQELSREEDGSFLIYGSGKPMKEWMKVASYAGGYAYPPFELTADKWRITFIGGEGAVKRFLAMLERFGLHYRIAHSTDARFAASSFLSTLTDQQRKVLSGAYRLGYFDSPRRIGVRELSKSINLRRSAVTEHLRKAQKRLLDEILTD